MPAPRIASLVPSATEMCFALGLGEQLVAVTHECDYPEGVQRLPQLTRSVIEPGLAPAEIDRAVRERTARGESLYELNRELLASLDVDLIVTQAVCAVCAVSYEQVCELAADLPRRPRVLSQDPRLLGEVLDDANDLAEIAGVADRGPALRDALAARIAAVRAAVEGRPRPRVAALEWLDPPYCSGHWVPEMIAAAGGEDVLSDPGERSRQLGLEEVAAAQPDAVIVMPCGLYCEEAAREMESHLDELEGIGATRIFAVDAASSFSRPGPRLADGVELLGHLLHPDAVDAPSELAFSAPAAR